MTKSELKNKLQKSIDFLDSELTQIRTGRANPSLVEDIMVEAYASKMTIKELGSITLADSQTILVAPWDKTLLQTISKAISESEHHLNPAEQGDVLRVPIPPLTEDRRKELVKLVSFKAEECKQSMRNIRQDAMKEIDREFEAKELSEDEKFTQRDVVEDTMKEFAKIVENTVAEKSKELMSV